MNVKRFAKRTINYVVVTARGDDAEYVKQLGAGQVIDDRIEAFDRQIEGHPHSKVVLKMSG